MLPHKHIHATVLTTKPTCRAFELKICLIHAMLNSVVLSVVVFQVSSHIQVLARRKAREIQVKLKVRYVSHFHTFFFYIVKYFRSVAFVWCLAKQLCTLPENRIVIAELSMLRLVCCSYVFILFYLRLNHTGFQIIIRPWLSGFQSSWAAADWKRVKHYYLILLPLIMKFHV